MVSAKIFSIVIIHQESDYMKSFSDLLFTLHLITLRQLLKAERTNGKPLHTSLEATAANNTTTF